MPPSRAVPVCTISTAKAMHRPNVATAILLLACLAAACGPGDSSAVERWAGSIDTLPGGQVVVSNPGTPAWVEGEEWEVVEELRLGSQKAEGPELFGRVELLEVDGEGRIWVFDGQAQEIRVFDPSGGFVRRIGRSGGGPGEFARAVRMELGPDDNIWIMDPQNNRLSVFDTSGVYLDGKQVGGGFLLLPWPGRFDAAGNYYLPVPRFDPEFSLDMVRMDTTLTPLDTLAPLVSPIEPEFFEHGMMRAGIPYVGSMVTRISREGTRWALITDQYRLVEFSAAGDTLRTITREFAPLPVTDADRERAREGLEWFTRQGGTIDLGRLPRTRPLARTFVRADDGHTWVGLESAPDELGHHFDIFDPEGRFLGSIRLPFPLSVTPFPLIRGDMVYGVTRDELDVQYVVRARIVKPAG